MLFSGFGHIQHTVFQGWVVVTKLSFDVQSFYIQSFDVQLFNVESFDIESLNVRAFNVQSFFHHSSSESIFLTSHELCINVESLPKLWTREKMAVEDCQKNIRDVQCGEGHFSTAKPASASRGGGGRSERRAVWVALLTDLNCRDHSTLPLI
jgi:hypothetical protein